MSKNLTQYKFGMRAVLPVDSVSLTCTNQSNLATTQWTQGTQCSQYQTENHNACNYNITKMKPTKSV